jgi:hypothetical protein
VGPVGVAGREDGGARAARAARRARAAKRGTKVVLEHQADDFLRCCCRRPPHRAHHPQRVRPSDFHGEQAPRRSARLRSARQRRHLPPGHPTHAIFARVRHYDRALLDHHHGDGAIKRAAAPSPSLHPFCPLPFDPPRHFHPPHHVVAALCHQKASVYVHFQAYGVVEARGGALPVPPLQASVRTAPPGRLGRRGCRSPS